MKKVLITGTRGFIGNKLCIHIKEIHDEINVLEINDTIFGEEDWHSNLKYKITKFNPEVVFHVGACSDTLEKDVNFMMIRNYESTKLIADYCHKHNKKLIYSSSAANYGTNRTHPSNLYGWSKYVAEDYVLNKGGVALRYFNVYGLGEQHKGKMASIAFQMMEKNENNETIKLFPDFPKRDFVYINDVISANLHAEKNYDKLKGKFYEVGTGNARTYEDVLELLNIKKFSYYMKSDIPDGYQFFTESDKDRWMTGWEPKFSLEDGLNDYILKFKFRNHKKLWIFGDSFSQPFSNLFTQNVEWSKKYKNYKKPKTPLVYGEILSKLLDLEMINHARGGVDNDYIFHCFINKLKDVRPGDIFIFNWTEITRFTLSSDTNELVTVIPFSHHDPPSKYITEEAINQIGLNRGEYNSYWQQINNYMKIIKSVLKEHEVYFWSWVKYEEKIPNEIWSNTYDDKILAVMNWSSSNRKTRQLIENEADHILDMRKVKTIDEVYDTKKKYKKLYVINVDDKTNRVKFNRYEDIIWLDIEDHYKTFVDSIIPLKTYETIKEETKDEIDDLHYSEQGQIDLSNDILNHIIEQKEIKLKDELIKLELINEQNKNVIKTLI